jgi:hypothetical protein
MQTIISHENVAVVIWQQGNHFSATFWVNARNGIQDATITTARWTGKTMVGAKKWAQRKIDAHYPKSLS